MALFVNDEQIEYDSDIFESIGDYEIINNDVVKEIDIFDEPLSDCCKKMLKHIIRSLDNMLDFEVKFYSYSNNGKYEMIDSNLGYLTLSKDDDEDDITNIIYIEPSVHVDHRTLMTLGLILSHLYPKVIEGFVFMEQFLLLYNKKENKVMRITGEDAFRAKYYKEFFEKISNDFSKTYHDKILRDIPTDLMHSC